MLKGDMKVMATYLILFPRQRTIIGKF
jgi:hypothetical protein